MINNHSKQIKRSLIVAKTISEFRNIRKNGILSTSSKIGFVPTMGALHDGHISLVKKSLLENDTTVVSIFVNPLQFSQGEDFDVYPRQTKEDLELLAKHNVDCVFLPNQSDFTPTNSIIMVDAGEFNESIEGRLRPNFFNGIATIVSKLFNIVQPNNAYFGQKDILQCLLIKRLVDDLNFPININILETSRNENGLALSSRNSYLSEFEREKSSILYLALSEAKAYIERNQLNENISKKDIENIIRKKLSEEKMVTDIEYISLISPNSLFENMNFDCVHGGIISIAIKVGNVRLIDNVLVGNASLLVKK